MITFNELVQKLLRFTYANLTDVSQDTGNALALLAGGAVLANGSYPLILNDAAPSSSGNTYNSWAALQAALATSTVTGPRLLVVVGDSHMTAGGPYDLDGWTIVPSDEFEANFIIDVGATIAKAPGGIHVDQGLTVTVDATAPVITDSGPGGGTLLIITNNSAIECTSLTGPFLSSAEGSVFLSTLSAIGDGTNPVVAGASGVWAYSGSIVSPNAAPACSIVVDSSSRQNGHLAALASDAGNVNYDPTNPAQWGASPPASVADPFIGGQPPGALDLLAAVLSNHVQASGSNLVAASPIVSTDEPFTCRGSGLKVRVTAQAVLSSSDVAVDPASMAIQLDDAAIVGAPACNSSIPIAGRALYQVVWDVTFPNNAAHNVRMLALSGGPGGTLLEMQSWTLSLQELLS